MELNEEKKALFVFYKCQARLTTPDHSHVSAYTTQTGDTCLKCVGWKNRLENRGAENIIFKGE